MVRVILSNPAILDIDEIFNYIARDQLIIAKNFIKNLFQKIELLALFKNNCDC